MRKELKKRRNEKKLTQGQLAKKAAIDRSYYSMIEQGKRTPSFDTAKRIGNILDIEIDPEKIFDNNDD